jgi:hypothetical protein
MLSRISLFFIKGTINDKPNMTEIMIVIKSPFFRATFYAMNATIKYPIN